jgi:hypothetical protein
MIGDPLAARECCQARCYHPAMALWVAYLKFKPGTNVLQGLVAFERRKDFQHPAHTEVLGEYWVNAPADQPQVVLVWEAEDEGPGDYYEAAWGDLFDVTIAQATRPVSELPETLPEIRAES